MYAKIIGECLAAIRRTDVTPQFVEASMRLQYGTLNHLARGEFIREARLAAAMWDEMPAGDRDAMVKSFGL